MQTDLLHTQQRLLSTSDSDTTKPSLVSLGSMRPTSSCLGTIGSRSTIHQLIGSLRKWNSDGARKSPALLGGLSQISPPPPPPDWVTVFPEVFGQQYFDVLLP